MSEEPPVTGDAVVDAALRSVADAADLDVATQAQVLSEAQTVLQNVLRASREEAQMSTRPAQMGR